MFVLFHSGEKRNKYLNIKRDEKKQHGPHQLYDAVQSQLDVDLNGRANIRRRGDVVLQLRIVVNQKLDKTQCMH